MAFIDPEGMFGGDRMGMLSDRARWMWPWLWCASNTCGRIELNYAAIMKNAFRQFSRRPSEEQFWAWVKEYHDCWLLFVYEDNGRIWGKWDVTERYLPKYKTSSDEKTPEPNLRAFVAWKNEYVQKRLEVAKAKCPVSNLGRNFSEGEKSLPIGIGIGIGEGKDSCPTKSDEQAYFDEAHARLWDVWWNRNAKKASRSPFEKRVRKLAVEKRALILGVEVKIASRDEAVQFLVDQAIRDQREWQPTAGWSWRQNLHLATWLNGERWLDVAPTQLAEVPKKGVVPISSLQRAIQEVKTS